MRKFTNQVYEWIDERVKLSKYWDAIAKHPVPPHVSDGVRTNPVYCLGGIAFLCFIILVITGMFLAMYYKPTPDEAYDSIRYIMEEVPMGAFIRSVHRWAANMMIAAVMLHMIRVYFTGAYKPPRELNWVIGVLLFLLTTAFGFTGYLLPWDQLAYWATTIGIQINSGIPVVGPYIGKLLMGGSEIGPNTLSRFYAIHTIVLPVTLALLLGAHFILVRIHGISGRYL